MVAPPPADLAKAKCVVDRNPACGKDVIVAKLGSEHLALINGTTAIPRNNGTEFTAVGSDENARLANAGHGQPGYGAR